MIEIRVECMNDTRAYLGPSEASMILNPSMTNIPHHVERFLKNPSLKNSHPEISDPSCSLWRIATAPSPWKFPPRKFPPGILSSISIIWRYCKRLCFSLNHSLRPYMEKGRNIQKLHAPEKVLMSSEWLVLFSQNFGT